MTRLPRKPRKNISSAREVCTIAKSRTGTMPPRPRPTKRAAGTSPDRDWSSAVEAAPITTHARMAMPSRALLPSQVGLRRPIQEAKPTLRLAVNAHHAKGITRNRPSWTKALIADDNRNIETSYAWLAHARGRAFDWDPAAPGDVVARARARTGASAGTCASRWNERPRSP